MLFRFPPDARWNPERSAVEFGIGVGDYEGVVRVPRRVFQILLPEAPTPERCLEAYHLHRTRLELVSEREQETRRGGGRPGGIPLPHCRRFSALKIAAVDPPFLPLEMEPISGRDGGLFAWRGRNRKGW